MLYRWTDNQPPNPDMTSNLASKRQNKQYDIKSKTITGVRQKEYK